MSEIVLKETMSHLDNSQEYYEKIKREIQSDNENDVNTNLHNDAIKSQLFSVNSFEYLAILSIVAIK
jgi:hypothetical protein